MAKAIVAQGIKNGADPFSLYFVLGEAAEKAGNRKEAEAAFLQAIAFRPSSHETLSRLGHLYLQENNFDQAAPYFARASELNPRSAGAFYYLGVAEEGRYRFFEAEKAYARALELAPDQTRFQRRYEAFKQKVAANTKDKIRVP